MMWWAFSVAPALDSDWFGAALTQTVVYGGPAVGSVYLIVRVVLGTQDKALTSTGKRIGELELRIADLEQRAAAEREERTRLSNELFESQREENRLQIELDRRAARIEQVEQQMGVLERVVRELTTDRDRARLLATHTETIDPLRRGDADAEPGLSDTE